MATEATIAHAYTEGRRAAESNKTIDDSPYYRNTEEWDAYRSGWLDRIHQLQKLKADDDQPDVDDIDVDPSHRV